MGRIESPPFEVGKDYHMEVGAVGNRITMKVWAVGDDEPELPQLVAFDNALTEGTVGLIPATSPTQMFESFAVDVTYDDVTFLASVVGDVNQDSVLDVGDIDRLTQAVTESETSLFFDFNQDREVTLEDRRVWVEELAGTFFGDVDLDGEVQFADFLVLAENFGEAGGWSHGNFDGVGTVDFPDFLLLAENFGLSNEPAAKSVPEPASLLLLVASTLFCAAHRQCRNTQSTTERE